ncbi:MAG: sensor hybrid histidine kinase [Myxococcaceae bacterium]|nr:sensor hybrid histidine kinase [Myxococcaceae bacterium]
MCLHCELSRQGTQTASLFRSCAKPGLTRKPRGSPCFGPMSQAVPVAKLGHTVCSSSDSYKVLTALGAPLSLSDMQASKLVVLVPDAECRDRVRDLASRAPVQGLHASVHVALDSIDVAIRDTRRALFEGPLAVLTCDEASALVALSAGADEAFAVDSFSFDAASWVHLVDRARLKSEARREVVQRLASLAELERVCALGRLVSGVADELTGPLDNALLSLQMLKRELDPLYAGMAELRELCDRGAPLERAELEAIAQRSRASGSTPSRAHDVLAEVTATCESVAQVASDLGLRDLGLRAPAAGASPQERHEYIDLPATLDRILRLFRRSAAKTTHIDRDYADDVPEVLAPRGRIAQVLISLVANSLASLRDAPHELHRLRIALRFDDALVTVTVSDTGPGLRAELLEHVFDSLPPPAAAAHGSSGGGLELAVARSIMRSLGGDLLVESLRGGGATYVAFLPRPRLRESSGSGTLRKPDFAPQRELQRRVVLLVEPDRQVLGALSRLLRERYEVLLALSGSEARSLIGSGTKPDAIVAAIDDPEGRRFVEWLLQGRADLARRLLLTTDLNDPGDELVGLPWLEKPLEPAALFRGIEARFVAPLRKARTVESKPARLANRG